MTVVYRKLLRELCNRPFAQADMQNAKLMRRYPEAKIHLGGPLVTTFDCRTVRHVQVTYSAAKNAANVRKHGISHEQAKSTDFDTARIGPDDSQDYGEVRYISVGFIGYELYVLIFTDTETDDTIRPISLRKARPSEEREYAEND